MALNTKRLDRTRKATKSNLSGFYRFEEGRNIIRIFSFNHKVVKADFEKGIYKKADGIKVGDKFDEVEREVLRHFVEDGVYNCPKIDCNDCEEAEKLLSSKSKADKTAGSKLRAGKAFFVNVIDMQGEEKEMQLGGLPSSVYDVILSYICDTEYGEAILGNDGRDFIVDRDKNQTPQKMYTVKIRDKDKCEKLTEDYETQDLFYIDALEPGWSSVDELNTYENKETDEEKKQRLKEEKAVVKKKNKATTTKNDKKGKEENPYKDEDKSGSKLPWEEKSFELKDIVSFEDEGETLEGYIIEIGDEIYGIQTGKTDSDIFDIPPDELTLVKKGKKGGRRRGK